MPHENQELGETMGHVWPGFSSDDITSWLSAVGVRESRHVSLPVDPRAKGPALFAMRATKAVE